MPIALNEAAVVGAGPAGLMAAEVLARAGVAVTVYDRMPSIGRKFLMAGRGGLNITHAEPLDGFLARYAPVDERLTQAVRDWPPDSLRAWCHDLGQETFVGSSGRVFPVAMKASPLLRAWRQRLDGLGVSFALRRHWIGWDEAGHLLFAGPDGSAAEPVPAAVTVLALGGASWPRLGSDGTWAAPLATAGIGVVPFQPANCGFDAPWSGPFLARHEGAPLKNVRLRFGDQTARGDMVITRNGLEGGALYGLTRPLRAALQGHGSVDLKVALRPDLTQAEIATRLAKRRPKDSLATGLRRHLKLSPAAIGLLQEAAHREPGTHLAGLDAERLAGRINAVSVPLTGTAPLSHAISTAGGVAFDELDGDWMLRRRPGVFVAGEMVDWEAPTGGYLLQACLASGRKAGAGACRWLERVATSPGSTAPGTRADPG